MTEQPQQMDAQQMMQMMQQKLGNVEITTHALLSVLQEKDIVDQEEINEEAQQREERIVNKVEGAGASIIKIDTRDKFSAKFAKYFDEAGDEW